MRQDLELTAPLQRNEEEADVQVEQYLAEMDRRCGACIS